VQQNQAPDTICNIDLRNMRTLLRPTRCDRRSKLVHGRFGARMIAACVVC